MVAGDYQAAAQGFAAFDDSESQYNRGNALAHSGDLSGALKAYDAALALAPDNTDAKRNRDLVEKMLKQQQQKNSAQSEQQNKRQAPKDRSEEHTSELQSLMRISYAVFCLKKKKHNKNTKTQQ